MHTYILHKNVSMGKSSPIPKIRPEKEVISGNILEYFPFGEPLVPKRKVYASDSALTGFVIFCWRISAKFDQKETL